jgi:hypothetical protein
MKTKDDVLRMWERLPKFERAIIFGILSVLSGVLSNKITAAPWLFWLLVGIACVSFLVALYWYGGFKKQGELARRFGYEFDANEHVQYQFREKIVVLLPLKEAIPRHLDDDIKRDTRLQLAGLFNLLDRDPALFAQFDIRWFSSANSPDVAAACFRKEREAGTRYFFCTMTDVCRDLAKTAFSETINDSTTYLICSVTSAHSEVFAGENILRYYIRTQDELKALFEHVSNAGWPSSRVCFVKGTHAYAEDVGVQLRAYLTGSHTFDEIPVDVETSVPALCDSISNITSDIYIVAAYGRTLENVIQAFDSLRAKGRVMHVLFTHTAASSLARCGFAEVLPPGDWACSIPNCVKWSELKQNEVISFLTEKAFEHLLRCVRAKDGRPFHVRWAKDFQDPSVRFLGEADADSEVLVKCQAIRKT